MAIYDDRDGLLASFLAGDFSAARLDDARPLKVIYDMISERLWAVGRWWDDPIPPSFSCNVTPTLAGIVQAVNAVIRCCANYVNTDYDYSKSFYRDFPKFWTSADIRSSADPMDLFPPLGSTEATLDALSNYRSILGQMYRWLKKCALIVSPKVVYSRSAYLEQTSEGVFEWVYNDLTTPETIKPSNATYYLRSGGSSLSLRELCDDDECDHDESDHDSLEYDGSFYTTSGSVFTHLAASNGYNKEVTYYPVWLFLGDIYDDESVLGSGVDIGGDGTRARAPGCVNVQSQVVLHGRWNEYGADGEIDRTMEYNAICKVVDSDGVDYSVLSQDHESDGTDGYTLRDKVVIYSPDWTRSRTVSASEFHISPDSGEIGWINMANPDEYRALTGYARSYTVNSVCSSMVPVPGPDLYRAVKIPANSSALVVAQESLPQPSPVDFTPPDPVPSDDSPIAGSYKEVVRDEGPYGVCVVGVVGPLFTVPSDPLPTPFATA